LRSGFHQSFQLPRLPLPLSDDGAVDALERRDRDPDDGEDRDELEGDWGRPPRPRP
jgi:hypothetical protein